MGGSSGGGSSGAVSHSAYLETIHGNWLDGGGVDTLTDSVTVVMEAALGASPWTTQAAYDPDVDLAANQTAITAFAAILAGMSDTVDWAALYTQAQTSIDGVTDAEIVADIAAFSDQLDDEITVKVLPRFRRGMQDINAVVSSAFVIGEAVIEGFRDRDVAKFSSATRLQVANQRGQQYLEASKQMLQLMLQRISWEDAYTKTVIEANRIKIVAKGEENEVAMKIDEKDDLWDLEVFQYGSNLLAGISGGTGATVKGPSTAQSAIGGAMSGAAAAAMIGSSMAAEGAVGMAAVGGPGLLAAGALLGAASAFL